MDTATGLVVNGFVLSSMYILVALGFVLLVSIIGIFNFAHGAIYMLGGYVTWGLSQVAGLSQWLSLLLSVIIIAFFGMFLERVCFRPFRNSPLTFIVIAIMLILTLETTVNIVVGQSARGLPAFVEGTVTIGTFTTSWERLFSILCGGVLLGGTTLFISKTRLGQQMLAVSQNTEGAVLQGINVNFTSMIATMIACGMAAFAGSLMSSLLSMSESMGDNILLKAIQVMILSGIGSMGGIVIGGLVVGFMDAVLPVYLSGAASQTISLFVIVGILIYRPRGLFGREMI